MGEHRVSHSYLACIFLKEFPSTFHTISFDVERIIVRLTTGYFFYYSTEFGKKGATQNTAIRLQTLYHADKEKTDMCILELATWLHRLISVVRKRDNGIRILPVKTPNRPGLNLQPPKTSYVQLSSEDRNLLEQVMSHRRLVPGISKSQEFTFGKKDGSTVSDASRSTGNSPTKRLGRPKSTSVLDVMDGLGTQF